LNRDLKERGRRFDLTYRGEEGRRGRGNFGGKETRLGSLREYNGKLGRTASFSGAKVGGYLCVMSEAKAGGDLVLGSGKKRDRKDSANKNSLTRGPQKQKKKNQAPALGK